MGDLRRVCAFDASGLDMTGKCRMTGSHDPHRCSARGGQGVKGIMIVTLGSWVKRYLRKRQSSVKKARFRVPKCTVVDTGMGKPLENGETRESRVMRFMMHEFLRRIRMGFHVAMYNIGRSFRLWP